ncbi:MAG: MG2 domain-containing protein [Paludibacteraceae bacterium]|nr:MG2 domain-containing protein [Paludibacteraceae bacterium]
MKKRLLILSLLLSALTLSARVQKPTFAQRLFAMQDSLEEVVTLDPSQADWTPVEQWLAAETNPAYRSVLHALLEQMNRRSGNYNSGHWQHVLDDMSALMRTPANEVDTTLTGDLLHSITPWVVNNSNRPDSIYELAAQAYEHANLPDSAFMMRLPNLQRYLDSYQVSLQHKVDTLDRLLAGNVPAAARGLLQAQLEYLTEPQVAMYWVTNMVNYDNEVSVVMKNIDEVTLTITGGVERQQVFRANWNGRDKRANNDTVKGIVNLPAGDYVFTLTGQGISQSQKVHLTSLSVLTMQLDGAKDKMIIVNTQTGRPEPQAKLENKSRQVRAVLSKNDFTDWIWSYDQTYASSSSTTTTHAALFTNRNLFRPGQTIQVALQCWQQNNVRNTATVQAKTNMEIVLSSPKGNERVVSVVTNAFGSADATFTLPADAELGYYSLICRRKGAKGVQPADAYTSIQVAEYKRPSFDITLSGTTADSLVTFQGEAKALSGDPMTQVPVRYTMQASYRYFRRAATTGKKIEGTCMTDEEGRFIVSDSIRKLLQSACDYMQITLTATITAPNGETQEQTAYTRVLYKPYQLTTTLLSAETDVVDVQRQPSFMVRAVDASDNDVQTAQPVAGVMRLTAKGIAIEQPFQVNLPIAFPKTLFCGDYTLQIMAPHDTLEQPLRIFNKQTASGTTCYTTDFAYHLPSASNATDIYTSLQEKDCYLFVLVSNQKGLLDSFHIVLPEGMQCVHVPYKSAYGQSYQVDMAYMRNGHSWSYKTKWVAPQPKTNLQLALTTFRNQSTPGAQEQWTVRLTDTLGRAVNAEMVATLYDAALDRIAGAHSWTLQPMFNRPYFSNYMVWHSSYRSVIHTFEHRLDYVSIVPDYKSWTGFDLTPRRPMVHIGGKMMKSSAMMLDAMAVEEEAAMVTNAAMAADALYAGGAAPMAPVRLRTDFREDPLWLPHAVSDKNGCITLNVTMPDALTEWRLLLLAHTKTMQCATQDTTLRVSKTVAVTPMWPRFVRQGDAPAWAASVRNNSTETLQGVVRLEIRSADSTHVLATQQQEMTIPASTTLPVTFAAPVDEWGEKIIATMIFASTRYSDGEQISIPVLPAVVAVPKDTVVETMQSPVALIKKAVSDVKMPSLNCAQDCALAIFIGRRTGKSTAKAETQLRALQQKDGSFSWCRGMEGNEYITLAVTDMLLRMPGVMNKEVQKALKWLDQYELALYRKQVNKKKDFPIEEHTIQYLLLSAKAGHPSAEVTQMQVVYLKELSRLALLLNNRREARRTPYSMYGVAQMADMYLDQAAKKEAKACLNHLVHYSVYREGFGRYYATDLAQYSWMDYKLPTQLAAISALLHADEKGNDYQQYTAEMLLWVLRQTQSQQWQNPVNILSAAELVERTQDTPVGEKWQLLLDRSADTYAQGALKIVRQLKADNMQVGQTATMSVNVTADRDMDFLKVTIPLPACVEPVEQLSGYRRVGNVWGFVAQHDDYVEVYINHFRTGTQTIEIPYYISRAGAYTLPAASVVSTYNPTFHADAAPEQVQINK